MMYHPAGRKMVARHAQWVRSYTVCTEERGQLEMLLQKYQMCSRVSLGKPKTSSTSYTLQIAAREAASLLVTPCLLVKKN